MRTYPSSLIVGNGSGGSIDRKMPTLMDVVFSGRAVGAINSWIFPFPSFSNKNSARRRESRTKSHLHEFLVYGHANWRHWVLEVFRMTVNRRKPEMYRSGCFICQLRRYGVPENHVARLVRHSNGYILQLEAAIKVRGEASGLRFAKRHPTFGHRRLGSDF